MVTFSIPGDDLVGASNGTPRSRPPLPFAKRAYSAASPFGGNSTRRMGTPHVSSGRKLLTRDEIPSSSLNRSSMGTARNIFQASTVADNPPTSTFSPSIPNSTMKKVFAPGATPEPSRVYRESMAHATPRGMAAKATTKELFSMRIASPPPELTGEVLTQKVPKEWNSKGSIYADQFLAHLAPPDLDEEQRRQFFCILDLRRLKYAANEIFARKDWKLNVINFAKEFEKSRSIILLRYGLYEFQNVKPSKDVLKRWRREHGLPEPEEEEGEESTPSKPVASKKRKATEDSSETPALKGKRRAMGTEAVPEPERESTAATPSMSKNKRKASVSEEQPTKMQKSTPSSAKSLFEKIANKPAAKSSDEPSAVAKPNSFMANKPATSSNLARSVFNNSSLKPPGQAASGSGGNIFGYLSDASSAKNSGVDADAESDTDSEQDDSQDANQSDGPSVAASGAGDNGSQLGSSLFSKKPAVPASGLSAELSSAPETRESTPGRSLFDRVTKGSDGQPIRLEERVDTPEPEAFQSGSEPVSEQASVTDQTWNPSKTPIKFAPSSVPTSSLFGNAPTSAAGSMFAPKPAATSNLFGASRPDQSSTRESSAGVTTDEAGKEGGESDKENETQPATKALEDKTPAAPPAFGSSLFQPRTTSSETPKEAPKEAPKPASTLFGAAPKTDSKPAESPSTSLFGQAGKPTESSTPSLFGAKPAEPGKDAVNGAPATPSLFGNTSSTPATSNGNSLFGAKPAASPSGLFGNSSSTSAQQPLFGAKSGATTDSTAAKADAPKPIFNFGNTSTPAPLATAAKPLFGAPKSPPAAASNNMFGSPMKQDDASPAKKKAFNGGSAGGDSTPMFSFGGNQASVPTSNLFGASSTPAQSSNTSTAGPVSFGGAATSNSGSGSGGFNFNFGGGSSGGAASGSAFNNPFAAGGNDTNAGSSAAPAASSGGMFAFGAGSSAPSGTSSPFQFGGAGANTSTPAGTGGSLFGGNQSTNNANPTFGGASGSSSAPSFNFSAGGAASQGTGSVFGSNQAVPAFNLQPPAGGSTTTGTNSPLYFGGGSSLATTPAAGTPEPQSQANGTKDGEANDEDGEKHEQINLTDGVDDQEEKLHEVRAKVLKFIPPADKSDDDKPKSKSPWSTQGVGPLRLLKHKETNLVRLLLRAEPRGHVALNRALLANMTYKADEKYVKLTTSNEQGDGLETWMIQVKTKDLAKELAEALEKNKEANKK